MGAKNLSGGNEACSVYVHIVVSPKKSLILWSKELIIHCYLPFSTRIHNSKAVSYILVAFATEDQ